MALCLKDTTQPLDGRLIFSDLLPQREQKFALSRTDAYSRCTLASPAHSVCPRVTVTDLQPVRDAQQKYSAAFKERVQFYDRQVEP